jgi:hypothetical protein
LFKIQWKLTQNCLAILCFQWPNVHCQRAKNTEKARRKRNAYNAAAFLGGRVESSGDYYDTQKVIAPDGRIWKFMSDGSIRTQKKENGRIVAAGREYSVELVSPILTYRDARLEVL